MIGFRAGDIIYLRSPIHPDRAVPYAVADIEAGQMQIRNPSYHTRWRSRRWIMQRLVGHSRFRPIGFLRRDEPPQNLPD